MRALILAAGYGKRLRPLTQKIPKCLVPIKGRPLLEVWLDRLTKAGAGPFLINTHYLAEKVEDFIFSSQFQSLVTTVYEQNLLGTAGTLISNLDFFHGEDGMLIHADNYCLADLVAFQQAHFCRPKGCLMTMMIFQTDNPSSCGIVELNDEGIVIGFHEKVKTPPGNLANGAVYILSAELLARIGTELSEAKDFSLEVINYCQGKIYTYLATDVFIDIGTPKTYMLANKC